MLTEPGESLSASATETWCVPSPCTSCSYFPATNCVGTTCDTGAGRQPPVTVAELQTGGSVSKVVLVITASPYPHFTGNGWIQPGSFTLTGTLNDGSEVDITDDGNGNLTGTGMTGTIDYVGGTFDVSVVDPSTQLPANVTYGYTYLGDDFLDVSMVNGFNVPIELAPAGNFPNGNEWAAKPQPCVENADCDTGFTCSNSQCVMSCTQDSDCGTYAATCDLSLNGGTCVNDQLGAYQCTAMGCAGAAGYSSCAPQSACPWDLLDKTSADYCPAALQIKNASGTLVGCIDAGDLCAGSNPPASLNCNTTYQISCVGPGDNCPSGSSCVSGKCSLATAPTYTDLFQCTGPAAQSCQIAAGLYNACFSNKDCMPGSICQLTGNKAHTCIDDTSFTCTSDSDCAPPGVCSTSGPTSGKCVSAGQACGTGNSCPSPLICNNSKICVQAPWCGGPLDAQWNTAVADAGNYPELFKAACPTAYSFPYDDGTSTFHCSPSAIGFNSSTDNTVPVASLGYRITFCPPAGGSSPTATPTATATGTGVPPTATPTSTSSASPTVSATPTATATGGMPTATATPTATPSGVPTPALLTTNPSGTVAFPATDVGQKNTQTLTVFNSNTVGFTLTTQKKNGNINAFKVTGGTCRSGLGGNSQCTYLLTYIPTNKHVNSGEDTTLLITAKPGKRDKKDSPQTIPLTLAGYALPKATRTATATPTPTATPTATATGGAPTATATSATPTPTTTATATPTTIPTAAPTPALTTNPVGTLAFPVTEDGQTATETLSVINSDPATSFTLTAQNLNGNVHAFKITGGNCKSSGVAADSTCTYSLTYGPKTYEGAQSTAFVITAKPSNKKNAQTLVVTLSGFAY
ncbi:MAG TPA: hypothetical protein VMD75_07730 [Candidatus Binataceae bacterium]|nr:hypothetical protein [Candidatus Binataceae bacterium]